MAHLHRSSASLRISGDGLSPSDISTLLGIEPTSAQIKGEPFTTPSGKTSISRVNQWLLEAKDAEPENVDAQVEELLGKLTSDLSVWHNISKHYEIELFCGFFMEEWNEGFEILPKTLTDLGVRGIKLGLDIYGP
jgi:hypothetical protein